MNGGMKVEVHESDLTAKLFTSMLLSFDGIEPEGRTYINSNINFCNSYTLTSFIIIDYNRSIKNDNIKKFHSNT